MGNRREEEDKQRRAEAERIMVENQKKIEEQQRKMAEERLAMIEEQMKFEQEKQKKKKRQKRSKRKFLERAMLDPNCRSALLPLRSIFFRFFLNFSFFNGLQIVYFFPKSINKTSF